MNGDQLTLVLMFGIFCLFVLGLSALCVFQRIRLHRLDLEYPPDPCDGDE